MHFWSIHWVDFFDFFVSGRWRSTRSTKQDSSTGARPGIFVEPGPQRSDRSWRRSAGDGLPTIGLPALAGRGSGLFCPLLPHCPSAGGAGGGGGELDVLMTQRKEDCTPEQWQRMFVLFQAGHVRSWIAERKLEALKKEDEEKAATPTPPSRGVKSWTCRGERGRRGRRKSFLGSPPSPRPLAPGNLDIISYGAFVSGSLLLCLVVAFGLTAATCSCVSSGLWI